MSNAMALQNVQAELEAVKAQLEQVLEQLVFGDAVGIRFEAALDDGTELGEIEMLTMTDSQQAVLTIKPVDKKGKPAQLDGVPVWTSSNTEVATVTPETKGLSVVVTGLVPGDATISVSADGDLGEGIKEIAGTLEVTVTSGAAVTVEITAGEPSEQE